MKEIKSSLIIISHTSPDSDSIPASVRAVPGASIKRMPDSADILQAAGKPDVLLVYPDSHDIAPLKNYLRKTSGGKLNLLSRDFEEAILAGIDRGEFELYYQPIINTSSGKLFGFESLLRWNHPDHGIVSPDEFIPEAEATGAIIPLGKWIIDRAMKQASQWEKDFPDHPLRLSINLSAKQFLEEGLSRLILLLSEKYGVVKENIAFEITESAFMEDMEKANIILLTLKAFNFPIYLDDFGTGFASLSYLLHFPVNTIKIDRSFVEWMHIDEQSAGIVKSVAILAHNLGMKIVAEGIETAEHLGLATEFECDYTQGYFYSKPLNSHDATEFIKSSK